MTVASLGRPIKGASAGIYGPRTIFLVAVKGFPGTHEFVLQDDGKWLLVKETTEISEPLPVPLACRWSRELPQSLQQAQRRLTPSMAGRVWVLCC